jgi:hypothetical protein
MTHVLRAACFSLGILASVEAALAQPIREGWTEYQNERFGLRLLYPADVFRLERTSEAGDGQVFTSDDGSAKLLVGALPNEAQQSPAQYQAYVANHSYSGFQVQYRPLGQSWFVLSGEGDGKTFYEKVMFSCDGRLINSFALLYPNAQRSHYDSIVERMEKSFRPGAKCEGLESERAEHSRHLGPQVQKQRQYPRSALADRIARQRGYDVIVVLRRSSPPYDRRVVRGYVSR